MKWNLSTVRNARNIEAITKRGTVLDGVLFSNNSVIEPVEMTSGNSYGGWRSAASHDRLNHRTDNHPDTVVIAITGIHGNFYSNPFYFNFGDTLNSGGIDFVYAQVCDAFGEIRTANAHTGKEEIIGSWNERFSYAVEDIRAYIDWAEGAGYAHIILAGHSLGANKVIRYLSATNDTRVEKFILLSPANLDHMTGGVSADEKTEIQAQIGRGDGEKMLPFPFMGWVECTALTAADWLSPALNNVHVEADGDFSQAQKITHSGALLIGTLDRFTYGNPAGYLRNINAHFPTSAQNRLIYIEGTGHTYQEKEQETAERILDLAQGWRNEWK